tara:strand:+ start:7034 stop:7201 length:168 start_codon:yes stop_codon:yes gene_type:complete
MPRREQKNIIVSIPMNNRKMRRLAKSKKKGGFGKHSPVEKAHGRAGYLPTEKLGE